MAASQVLALECVTKSQPITPSPPTLIKHKSKKGEDSHHDHPRHHHKHHDRNHHDNKSDSDSDKDKHINTQLVGSALEAPQPKQIRNDLNSYLEHKIAKYMKKGLSREQAVAKALTKANAKNYAVLTADSGHGYGFVMGSLEKDIDGRFVLALDGGNTKFASRSCRKMNDSQLVIDFLPTKAAAASVTIVPSRGLYNLTVRLGEGNMIATEGMYDLQDCGVVHGSGNHLVPMKLCRDKKLKALCRHGLPYCEIYVIAEAIKDGRVAIKSVQLVTSLKPSAAAILDRRSSIPMAGETAIITPSRYLVGYSTEEEKLSAECASKPTGLADVISKIFANHIGIDGTVGFRFASHVGKTSLCQVGRSGTSHKEFYRIGHALEPVAVIALCSLIEQCTPEKFGRRVDLHDPELTRFLLTMSGALNILKGLEICFSSMGTGVLPSPFDLMNHTSGLPSHFEANYEVIRHILEASKSVSNEAHGTESEQELSMEVVEKILGEKLARHATPICSPGTCYHHSHLDTMIMRFMIPDWKHGPHSCDHLLKVASELGMPTLNFTGCSSAEIVASHAPSCAATAGTCVPTMHSEPESPMYMLSTGASCRVDEYADFLAATGTSSRHSWLRNPKKLAEGSIRYAFLPDTIPPRVAINREGSVYYSYGWVHVKLACKGFGKHGLRALMRVGYTPTHHVFVACMVPALSLSFCFGTNSDMAALCAREDKHSIVPLLAEIVTAHIAQIASLENRNLKKACFYNPILNTQLVEAPADGHRYVDHVRYCEPKTPLHMERDTELDPFCGEAFLSLVDIRHSKAASTDMTSTNAEHYLSPVKLSIRYEEITVGDEQKGIYRVTEHFAHGDEHTFDLVYDADAYRSTEAARNAIEKIERGLAPDNRNRGAYRVIESTDGLLGEYLKVSMVELSAKDITSRKEQVPLKAKIVCFRGRIYVRGGLYDLIRQKLIPTMQDRVNLARARLAGTPATDSEAAAASGEEDEIDQEAALLQQDTSGKGTLADLLRETAHNASQASIGNNILPRPKDIKFRGGGWRGGGGWGGGGWGYGGGFGIGLGTGVGLGVGAGLYGPAYYPPYPGVAYSGYGYPYHGGLYY